MKKLRILEVIDRDGKSKFHIQCRLFGFLWWRPVWYLEWRSMDGEFENWEPVIMETLQDAKDLIDRWNKPIKKVIHECNPMTTHAA